MRLLPTFLSAAALALTTTAAPAAAVFSQWSSINPSSGHYQLTVVDTGSQFDWTMTVSPWDAEVLGVFVDFGAVSMPASVPITGVTGAAVTLAGKDTADLGCGSGCNLNGLSLPGLGGGDWELVFRLGNAGFDGVRTFRWVTPDFGLGEGDLRLVGVRAQQFCPDGLVLPSSGCTGSDKAWAWPTPAAASVSVPAPPVSALVLGGVLGLALSLRRRR